MPLFALSGSIISMGFILILNLFALNYAWDYFHSATKAEDKISPLQQAGIARSQSSSHENIYWLLDRDKPDSSHASIHSLYLPDLRSTIAYYQPLPKHLFPPAFWVTQNAILRWSQLRAPPSTSPA